MHLRGIIHITFIILLILPMGLIGQDSTRFDREVLGRPFDLKEMFGAQEVLEGMMSVDPIPLWIREGSIPGDTVYFGIGHSSSSPDEADDEARLRFAQHVEVKVQSIAREQISENAERLQEDYSYESQVITNMSLRSVSITERFVDDDSTFHSLIMYRKGDYHALVTEEIRIALESDIKQQEMAHQALEALRADSLRHKLAMDSLALSRKQASIDSLNQILKMEESRQKMAQERIELIKKEHAAFLEIRPRFELVDLPTAGLPKSWVYLAGRVDPQKEDARQLKFGASLSLFSAELNLHAHDAVIDQGDVVLKLQVMPERGDIYPIRLVLGWTAYDPGFSPANRIDLNAGLGSSEIMDRLNDEFSSDENIESSFLVIGTIGIPQYNNHISLYIDKRYISLSNIWYPFPRHLGDAISLVNQIDYIQDESYRNRFDDLLQYQFGLRLIAVPNRFATMVSYEDHEVWRLNFELQF